MSNKRAARENSDLGDALDDALGFASVAGKIRGAFEANLHRWITESEVFEKTKLSESWRTRFGDDLADLVKFGILEASEFTSPSGTVEVRYRLKPNDSNNGRLEK